MENVVVKTVKQDILQANSDREVDEPSHDSVDINTMLMDVLDSGEIHARQQRYLPQTPGLSRMANCCHRQQTTVNKENWDLLLCTTEKFIFHSYGCKNCFFRTCRPCLS